MSPSLSPSPSAPGDTGRAAVRVRGRHPLDLAIAVTLLAGLVLRVLLFGQVAHAPFTGDEVAYADAGKAIANLFRDLVGLHGPDAAELRRNVIGSGWFMPGMALLLSPIYLVVPHADDGLARAWLGLLALVLYVVAVVDVRRTLGRWWALGLAVVPGLVPMWLLFSYTAYGDLVAGLVATVLIVRMVAVLRGASAGTAPRPKQAALIGFLAIATVYLRSSSTPLVLGVGVVGLLALLWTGRRALMPLLLAAGIFLGLLAPWSIAASTTFHARVITTTSVPMALANSFGDRRQVCYGMCDPGSTIWFSPVRYAREVARATGHSEVTVLSQMSAYARRDVTAHTYARDVIADWHNYRDDPAAFLFKLRPAGATHETAEEARIRSWTDRFFGPMLWLAAAGLLVMTRRSRRAQLLSVLATIGLYGLLLQPFVHLAGARYWTTAAPLAALSAMVAVAAVVGWARDRVPDRLQARLPARVRAGLGPHCHEQLPPGERPSLLLTLAQAALAVLGIVVVATIRILA